MSSIIKDIIELSYEDITKLFKKLKIKDNRIENIDFDGGHFAGEFDNYLKSKNQIRLCTANLKMIIVDIKLLETAINKVYNKKSILIADALYKKEDSEYYQDYLGAYFEIYKPILDELHVVSDSIYVDALDYILSIYKIE